MSWTMMGWIILAVIALIVIFVLLQKGTAPGFSVLNSLGGN